MISVEDGSIEFEEPRIGITRCLMEHEFLGSALFPLSRPITKNPPYMSYAFHPMAAMGEKFCGGIFFRAGHLQSIELQILKPEFNQSWDDWTNEKLLIQHAYQNAFLLRILPRRPDSVNSCGSDPREKNLEWHFPFCRVESAIDSKMRDTCAIGISYVLK